MNSFEHTPPQEEQEEGISKEDALEKLKFLRQKVAIMGFNDSEISEFNRLIEAVDKEELDSQAALDRAYEIIDSKQDYH